LLINAELKQGDHMGRAGKKKIVFEVNLPGTCPADLRGRQSVRATFRLSSGCIDALSVVARHLGIKQKSLFDHLVEDIGALKSIAEEAGHIKAPREHRIQKTFVISRRSLCSLEEVSKNYNTPRDALVEYSVQRLLPLIEAERLRQEKRKEMLIAVQKHFRQGVVLLEKWEEMLGGEDPLLDSLASAMHGYENALRDMDDIVERGKLIEMFTEGK
jgi:hypothetical protein